MVDPITAPTASGGIASDGAATRVAQAPATPPAILVVPTQGSAAPGVADTAQTSGLARQLAESPPVDTDRVATIRKAIAEGRFPILPATIADRLIALKLQWDPNEPQ